ncbi:MAG TPA: hypothetical protein VFA20_27405, partial [Myxococcaceae bacterium]|nr:hypothetical protein [Myxococcaceae bacterium]
FVRSAVFSPDGLRVLTASDDNTARIWDASSGKLLAELRGHSGPVWSAVFSPDGLRVLTASKDNTAHVWDVSGHIPERLLARDPGRDFTCEERIEYLHEVLTCPEPVSH